MAPVGIRCPDHSGKAQGVARVTRGARRVAYEGKGYVTRVLIGLNVGVYALELIQGAGVNGTRGSIYENGVLIADGVKFTSSGFEQIGVAHGEWWRMLTAAFLHYGPFHLLVNMVSLWWIGSLLERRIGAARFLGLYLVSGIAGSAGALVVSPNAATVGASGAIFGILGAGLVLERQRDYVFGGGALGLIVLNLAITFGFGLRGPISIGGHVGGLIGGILVMLGLSRFGRTHAAYGRPGVLGIATMLGVAVVSVLIAYLKVRSYA